MSIGHGALGLGIRGNPLPGTGRALGELPVVLVQIVEESVVPLRRLVGPGALQTAGSRVCALAGAVVAFPAKTLLLDRGGFGLRADVFGGGRAMGFADRVAADDERNRLLVIHRHATERLSDVPSCGQRVRGAVWALRVHVDEAHLNRAERPLELPVAAVALISEPGVLRAPEDLLRLPDVLSPE